MTIDVLYDKWNLELKEKNVSERIYLNNKHKNKDGKLMFKQNSHNRNPI